MRKCFKCNININTNVEECPLCQSPLKGKEKTDDVFPVIMSNYNNHTLLYKLLLLISVTGILTCIFINYSISKHLTWSYFVIAAIGCFWATLLTAIQRRNYFLKLLFTELNVILIASILWDFITGWHNWSITFVLPLVCISYIVSIFILRLFIRRLLKDYIIYSYVNCLIGMIPLYFVLTNKVSIMWPSIACVVLCGFLMITLMIFNKKQVTSELERRFHF